MTSNLVIAGGSAPLPLDDTPPGSRLVPMVIDLGYAAVPSARIYTVRDTVGLVEFYAWLTTCSASVLGIDCETNGVDPWAWDFRLRTVQIADERTSWVIVVEALSPEDRTALARMIHNHPRFVAHYSEVDIRFLGRGLPGAVRMGDLVPHIVDTQVVMATYDPRTVTTKSNIDPRIPRKRGLKDTSQRLISPVLVEAERAMLARFRELAPVGHRTPEKCKTWGFANIPNDDPTYLIYGGLDPLFTAILYRMGTDEIRRRGQWGECATNMVTQWYIDMATYKGMPVDPDYVRWLDGELSTVVSEKGATLTQYGIGASGQGPAVGKAFKALGVATSPVVKTKNGKTSESWDKVALAALMDSERYGFEVAELASAIGLVRKSGKFRSTYIAPMLAAIERDGWVRCSMRAIGTVTGRMSARKPALQQLPKKDTRIRAAFRAPAGWVFVSADLSQGEPRTMAALSGDQNYLRDLLAGDINSTLATLVYGDEYDPAQGEIEGTPHYLMRQQAKTAWLAWCYGAAAAKIASTLGRPESEGAALVAKWSRAYPDLAALIKRLNNMSEIVLDSGRVCPLWDRWYVTDSGELRVGRKPSRKGLNYATQGTQRDLLVHAVRRLAAAGWVWALAFLVHDEILMLVPAWMAEQARDALAAAMTMTYRGVPIECKAKINGETWLPQPATFDTIEIRDEDDLDLASADAMDW